MIGMLRRVFQPSPVLRLAAAVDDKCDAIDAERDMFGPQLGPVAELSGDDLEQYRRRLGQDRRTKVANQ